MKVLVIGLGNPILTDDGIGVKVAQGVAGRLTGSLERQVTVTEAGVGGLRLMEMMIGFDQVILVDALQPHASELPGTICRLTLEDLKSISPTQHSSSAHDTSLVTALEMGRRMGFRLPRQVHIFGIAVENILDFSEECTPAVAKAIPLAVDQVLAELTEIAATVEGSQPVPV